MIKAHIIGKLEEMKRNERDRNDYRNIQVPLPLELPIPLWEPLESDSHSDQNLNNVIEIDMA